MPPVVNLALRYYRHPGVSPDIPPLLHYTAVHNAANVTLKPHNYPYGMLAFSILIIGYI